VDILNFILNDLDDVEVTFLKLAINFEWETFLLQWK